MPKCPKCGNMKIDNGRYGVFVCNCGYYYKPNINDFIEKWKKSLKYF